MLAPSNKSECGTNEGAEKNYSTGIVPSLAFTPSLTITPTTMVGGVLVTASHTNITDQPTDTPTDTLTSVDIKKWCIENKYKLIKSDYLCSGCDCWVVKPINSYSQIGCSICHIKCDYCGTIIPRMNMYLCEKDCRCDNKRDTYCRERCHDRTIALRAVCMEDVD
jgi:hypothetical protein